MTVVINEPRDVRGRFSAWGMELTPNDNLTILSSELAGFSIRR